MGRQPGGGVRQWGDIDLDGNAVRNDFSSVCGTESGEERAACVVGSVSVGCGSLPGGLLVDPSSLVVRAGTKAIKAEGSSPEPLEPEHDLSRETVSRIGGSPFHGESLQ